MFKKSSSFTEIVVFALNARAIASLGLADKEKLAKKFAGVKDTQQGAESELSNYDTLQFSGLANRFLADL